jgi:RNA polymerase sigma-70 factor (sigma-E family)
MMEMQSGAMGSSVGHGRHEATEVRPVIEPDAGTVFRVAFDTNYSRLVGLATLLVDDGLAEEIVQEAFAQTWRRWDAVRDHAEPIGYLRQAVINESRGRLRRIRSARRAGWRAQPPVATSIDPAAAAEADETRVAVLAALACLTTRQRECVALRYYGDCSVAETAAALGISEGAVKSHSHRALERLATLLEGTR